MRPSALAPRSLPCQSWATLTKEATPWSVPHVAQRSCLVLSSALPAARSGGLGAAPQQPSYAAPVTTGAGNGFSIAGIVLGIIALLIFPPLFGIAGLVMGAIALSRKESKAVIAMVVSGVGLVLGMLFGMLSFM